MSGETVAKHGRRPIFVELDAADRAALDRIVARASRSAKRKVKLIEVVRALIRGVDASGDPLDLGRSTAFGSRPGGDTVVEGHAERAKKRLRAT